MSSYPGQQNNLPFGYNPDSIHGMGLPDFMTPGPAPGAPLLNDSENQNLDSFFSHFDTNAKPPSYPQFADETVMTQRWDMPPTYVGAETSLGPRAGIDPHQLQMGTFMFNDGFNGNRVVPMAPELAYDQNMHVPNGFSDAMYSNMLNQTPPAGPSMQSAFGTTWQQPFQAPSMMPVQTGARPLVRFGSDSHFAPSGYAAPNGPTDSDVLQHLDWVEAQSSATNTQPNTQPSTQPSSPNWSKKRKLDQYQEEVTRIRQAPTMPMRHDAILPPVSAMSRKRRKPVKHEQSPPSLPSTPVSNGRLETCTPPDDDDDDSEDESELKSPQVSSQRPTKGSRSKKPSTTKLKTAQKCQPNTPIKPKSRLVRQSSSAASVTARTPLTADQKKANHTNSEQRRRDQTAKAYCDLYDLVPELECMGKQSTMKKLEIVVQKLAVLKAGNEQLTLEWKHLLDVEGG